MRPSVTRPPRDLRLDLVRGWLQLSIFASHAFGSFVGGWLIHAAWGLSDSSEQFVLLSGFVLGSVFALKAAREGEGGAARNLLRRAGRLYATHLAVFALFGAMILWAERALPLPGEAAAQGWTLLAERSDVALALAPTMLWQPAFMGILPIFVWCMLLLPSFLWLVARIGTAALMAPVGLYAGVHLFGWATPALGGNGIAFDPLAWQVLFLGGAWLGRRTLLSGGGAPVLPPRDPRLLALAAAVLLFGLWFRLVQYGWIAGPAIDATAVVGKERLALPRLLHALALAYLVGALVPREAAWMHRWLPQALAAVGRHSLHVFCLGLFLSWGAATAFRLWPAAVAWLDPLAIGAGSAVLIGFAQLLERRRGKQASGHLAFEVARSSEARRLGGAPPRAIPSAPGGVV
ncbi:MAG: OpgC domain-containing protein [Acetobacteraceae bacterium]|nr:OpgC domain-containing protein [Acetobacteraceae bacterium]